ncbi:MAG: MoxR family ATPase [Pseudomonadota bacterium]
MTLNTVSISAGDALEALLAGWEAQAAGRMTVSYMLHGRPGVGKTQIVQQMAERIGARLVDLRLTTIEPQDLRGLPYYDHERARTTWYRPEDLPDSETEPAVLFLDELTAASPMLQPTVYGLLQERRVGRHTLPDTVFVVAAGNTVEDGAIAYEMGTALSDRLIHLHVKANASDWLDNFAVPRGLHPAVTAFIRTRADLLETIDIALQNDRTIAATPRSWERVSDILFAVPDRKLRTVMIAGTVGDAIAGEFNAIADDIAATVRITDMLEAEQEARLALYPSSLHGLNALVFGLVGILNADNADKVIGILAAIRKLSSLRPEAEFQRMPLSELCTYGFEALIRRGFELGLEDRFLEHPDYRAYADERQAAGLD